MADKLDQKLKEKIIKEQNNVCKICGRTVREGNGAPHHIIKVGEEPLLRNCKTNIWWVCQIPCHDRTENEPGFNHELQLQLQEFYFQKFQLDYFYTIYEIQQIVDMPIKDLEKAKNKGILKNSIGLVKGIDAIRFLMGGSIKE